jgi:hypothetical protein
LFSVGKQALQQFPVNVITGLDVFWSWNSIQKVRTLLELRTFVLKVVAPPHAVGPGALNAKAKNAATQRKAKATR